MKTFKAKGHQLFVSIKWR